MLAIPYKAKHLISELYTENISSILVISSTTKWQKNDYFSLSAFFMTHILEWNLLKNPYFGIQLQKFKVKISQKEMSG